MAPQAGVQGGGAVLARGWVIPQANETELPYPLASAPLTAIATLPLNLRSTIGETTEYAASVYYLHRKASAFLH